MHNRKMLDFQHTGFSSQNGSRSLVLGEIIDSRDFDSQFIEDREIEFEGFRKISLLCMATENYHIVASSEINEDQ